MSKKKQARTKKNPIRQPSVISDRNHHERIFSVPDQDKYLDSSKLQQLEQAFSDWTEASARKDIRVSRKRILIIFLLIRYTGAKLSEVLGLNFFKDIDFEKKCVWFGQRQKDALRPRRKVQLAEKLCLDIQSMITEPEFKKNAQKMLNMDPGFVRRKFYEQAVSCGFPKQLGAPEIIRKSRAVELMQNNMPLPAVQMILGHKTPSLTSSYVTFSEDDIQQVSRFYMEKESTRKTSARNSFFGKISEIHTGDIQSRIRLITIGGHQINTVITNDSITRLGLKKGKMITAEVKAPWVMLHKTDGQVDCSADNVLSGSVEKITSGTINTEYIVRLSDGTEVCSLITSESHRRLGLKTGDTVSVLFSVFSVVLLSG